MQPWRSRWRSVRAVNVMFVILVTLLLGLALGILVHQSMNWPGRPAGSLRPAWGLWFVAMGYIFLVAIVRRSRKRPKKVKAAKRVKQAESGGERSDASA